MTLLNFLSFVDLIKVCLFTIPLNPCSAIHLHKLVRQIIYFFSLPFLPSVCPVSGKFYKLSFLIMCPRNFNSLFLILSISILFLFSLKLPCYSYVQSMGFSATFLRITSRLPQVFFFFSSIIHSFFFSLINYSFILNSICWVWLTKFK